MPIAGWLCSGCGGREVPLDHFATSVCGERVLHPAFANAVLHSETTHYGQRLRAPEVSHGLYCPRKSAILDAEAVHVNPAGYNAALTGKALHAILEDAPADGTLVERVVQGRIGTVNVVGKPDVLRPARKLIEDFKHQSDYAAKYAKEWPKREHVAQVSLYAELVEQSLGWRPERGIIWYHTTSGGFKPVMAELMTIGEVEDFHPLGGQYSVAQMLLSMSSYFGGLISWDEMPMFGEGQMFGQKTACDYCPVRHVCWEKARGAGF